MKMAMCSIYDIKAEAWLNPMFFLSKGQASRSFTDVVNDGKSEFSAHPEDYTLFLLGYFHQDTGAVEVIVPPEPVALGINVKVEKTYGVA